MLGGAFLWAHVESLLKSGHIWIMNERRISGLEDVDYHRKT